MTTPDLWFDDEGKPRGRTPRRWGWQQTIVSVAWILCLTGLTALALWLFVAEVRRPAVALPPTVAIEAPTVAAASPTSTGTSVAYTATPAPVVVVFATSGPANTPTPQPIPTERPVCGETARDGERCWWPTLSPTPRPTWTPVPTCGVTRDDTNGCVWRDIGADE